MMRRVELSRDTAIAKKCEEMSAGADVKIRRPVDGGDVVHKKENPWTQIIRYQRYQDRRACSPFWQAFRKLDTESDWP